MTFFKRALSKKENDGGSLLGIGLIHRRLGLTQETCYWVQRCLNVDDTNQKAISTLSQSCLDTDKIPEAIEVMESAIESYGEKPSFMMTLARLYIKDGQVTKGNLLLDEALDLGTAS